MVVEPGHASVVLFKATQWAQPIWPSIIWLSLWQLSNNVTCHRLIWRYTSRIHKHFRIAHSVVMKLLNDIQLNASIRNSEFGLKCIHISLLVGNHMYVSTMLLAITLIIAPLNMLSTFLHAIHLRSMQSNLSLFGNKIAMHRSKPQDAPIYDVTSCNSCHQRHLVWAYSQRQIPKIA